MILCKNNAEHFNASTLAVTWNVRCPKIDWQVFYAKADYVCQSKGGKDHFLLGSPS